MRLPFLQMNAKSYRNRFPPGRTIGRTERLNIPESPRCYNLRSRPEQNMKNPFLENFRPYIPDSANLRELTLLPLHRRNAARHYFRCVVALSGFEDGTYGFGLDTGGGHRDHAVPPAVEDRDARRDDSRGERDADRGSAGESIAFGIGVTMPAIMILGFDLELTRVMLVAVMGGLLGILMMIPLGGHSSRTSTDT